MGDCKVFFDEVRVSVRNPELTEVWVYIRGEGDCPFQFLGWHYKAFPAPFTTMELFESWGKGEQDPMMWPRQNPPATVENIELPNLFPEFDKPN